MQNNIFIVTDTGKSMSIEVMEKLRKIEPKTYEEQFCIENEAICCYLKGTNEECQNFINNLDDKELQDYLAIRNIKDSPTIPSS